MVDLEVMVFNFHQHLEILLLLHPLELLDQMQQDSMLQVVEVEAHGVLATALWVVKVVLVVVEMVLLNQLLALLEPQILEEVVVVHLKEVVVMMALLAVPVLSSLLTQPK